MPPLSPATSWWVLVERIVHRRSGLIAALVEDGHGTPVLERAPLGCCGTKFVVCCVSLTTT